MALERFGLRAVLENASGYIRDANRIVEANKKLGSSAQEATKMGGGLSRLLPKLGSTLKSIGGVAFKAVAVGAAAATAAIVAFTAAISALAARGATYRGLAVAFDNITASVGLLSSELLTNLRQAAGGMVSDIDLLRTANLALAGATGEAGKEIGENLPRLMEIARVQARATGQPLDYLFQSLVTGLKRSSPLLIDNTGLVLKVGEANRRYAEKVGKTVDALTSQEKQIALLQATLEAGQHAIDALGNSNETAAEKMARAGATITNIFDTLSIAIQPAFEAVLDLINQVLGGIAAFVQAAAPYIAAIAGFIGELIKGINLTIGPQGNLAQNLFVGGARAFGALAQGIMQAANEYIFPAVIGIAEFIRDFLMGLSPPKKGPLSEIDKGGAGMMVAWLQGITGVSLDPVKNVAQEVADLLGGVGGLARAQVEKRLAALDAALAPFQQRLDIVKSTFDAISQPAQAALDAIDRQITQAVNALGRGEEGSAAAVRALDAQRAAIHNYVDAQQQSVGLAQTQLFLAQAQQERERTLLNIRLAQLGPERQIAAARQKAGGGRAAKAKKTATGKATPTTTAAGGAGIGITPPGAPGGPEGVLAAFGLGSEDVTAAGQELSAAFQSQIDPSTFLGFQRNRARLANLNRQIGSVDIGGRISSRFSGIKDSLEKALEDARKAVEDKVAEIGAFFTDADRAGSIPHFFQTDLPGAINGAKASVDTAIANALSGIATFFNITLPSQLEGVRADIDIEIGKIVDPKVEGSIPYRIGKLGTQLQTKFTIAKTDVENFFKGIFDPETEGSAAAQVKTFIDTLLDPDNEASIPYRIGSIGGAVVGELNRAVTSVRYFFASIFDPEREDSAAAQVIGFIDSLINPDIEGSIPNWFSTLPEKMSTALGDLGAWAQQVIIAPIASFLTGTGEGTLSSILDQTVTFFRQLPSRLVQALATLGTALWHAIVDPAVQVINSLIAALESGLRDAINGMVSFIGDIASGLESVGIDPGVFRDLAGRLSGAAESIQFGRISAPVPGFLTQAAQGAPVTNNNTNVTINNNFTGGSPEPIMAQMAALRA